MAVDRVNGYKLDKAHVFRVMPYEELHRLSELSSTYVAPPAAEFQPRPDLQLILGIFKVFFIKFRILPRF